MLVQLLLLLLLLFLQTIVGVLVGGGRGGGGEVLKRRFFGQCRWIFLYWLVFIKKNRGRVLISDFVTVDLVYLLRKGGLQGPFCKVSYEIQGQLPRLRPSVPVLLMNIILANESDISIKFLKHLHMNWGLTFNLEIYYIIHFFVIFSLSPPTHIDEGWKLKN